MPKSAGGALRGRVDKQRPRLSALGGAPKRRKDGSRPARPTQSGHYSAWNHAAPRPGALGEEGRGRKSRMGGNLGNAPPAPWAADPPELRLFCAGSPLQLDAERAISPRKASLLGVCFVPFLICLIIDAACRAGCAGRIAWTARVAIGIRSRASLARFGRAPTRFSPLSRRTSRKTKGRS